MGQRFADCAIIESRTLYQRLVTSKGKGTVTKYVYKVQKILKEIAAKSG